MVLMLVLTVPGSHIGGCRADLTQKTGQKGKTGKWTLQKVPSWSVGSQVYGLWLLIVLLRSFPPCPQAKGSQAQQL